MCQESPESMNGRYVKRTYSSGASSAITVARPKTHSILAIAVATIDASTLALSIHYWL